MYDKLKAVEKRYNDLNELLSDPKVIAQQSEFQKYAKEQSELTPIVNKFQDLQKFVKELDVKDEPLPITAVANTLMSKEQYLATKCRQYVLDNKAELTVEEQLEKVIVDSALIKESNLEKMLSKAKAVANRK